MNEDAKGLVRKAPPLDVDKQGVVNSLIDSLGLEGVRCGGNGIPGLADRSRGLTGEMVARVLSVVARRAGGATWKELEADGHPFRVIHPMGNKSKVLSRLFKAGEEAFLVALRANVESVFTERVTRPKKRFVIGRVAKDTDGVLRHPETGELLELDGQGDKILEFAMAKLHPAFKDQQSVNVGSQVTYNIEVVAPPQMPERPADIVDVTPESGGNLAGIPLDV